MPKMENWKKEKTFNVELPIKNLLFLHSTFDVGSWMFDVYFFLQSQIRNPNSKVRRGSRLRLTLTSEEEKHYAILVRKRDKNIP